MDKFERVCKLHNILRDRRTPVARAELTRQLECHEQTVFRLIRILKNFLHAPIEWHEELGGYYYKRDAEGGTYELPGLWIADERWHPQQVGQYLTDGRFDLRIPYRDERELVLDILRQGPHVEVVSPVALRDEVARQLRAALAQYDAIGEPR